MKPTIVVDHSPESLLIHWFVLEKQCPLDVELQERTDLVRAPYYIDGDVLIYDLPTLIQFLQERYPGEQLLPADPVSRAQIRQACTLISEPDVDTLAEIEEILDHDVEFITGRKFTLLDIFVTVWLSEHYTLDSSSVRSYWERLSHRETFRKAADVY